MKRLRRLIMGRGASEVLATALRQYIRRWRQINIPARWYLLHAALLTSSLAITSLLFNVAIEPFGFTVEFLGQLNELSVLVAAALSVPLWWSVSRIGLRPALLISGLFQALGAIMIAVWPAALSLQLSVALTGMAATLFQVSSPPFMMQHSDGRTRDHLFSANSAINLALAGVGSLIAGRLPALFGALLGVGAESSTAYRATFAVAGVGLIVSLIPLLLIKQRSTPPAADDTVATPLDGERSYVPAEHDPPAAAQRPVLAPHESLPTTTERRGRWRVFAPLLDRLPPTVRDLLRSPWPVLELLISPLLISIGAALLIPYLNRFFKLQFDLSDSVLGVIFAGLGITTGVAALAGPIISTRIGKMRTIVLTQLVSIPFLLMVGFVPVLGIAAGAALLRGALFNMGSPLYDAFAMERIKAEARPIVIGLINGAYTVGYLVTPRISTRLQADNNFAALFLITTLCYLLAAFANYWLFLRRQSPAHAAQGTDKQRAETPDLERLA